MPSRLAFGNDSDQRRWNVTWVDGDDVGYTSFAYDVDTNALEGMAGDAIVATTDGTLPALASRDQFALLSHGVATGPAAVLHRL